ncbi:MAG: prepilin-type N-terminal cleavage/methylation domain-containing protein [Gammaproteobacteria bacterium]|nr:prepilin-type N-terminal cleavage/methylation domain-containing protein [Gammaproteobacteria bacterium]
MTLNATIATARIARNPIANNRGFTLIELMIGAVVSLVVMTGVANVFVGTVKSSSETLKASKLNQDMQAIMNIVADDIRRTGYWNSLASGAAPTNPFTDTDNLHLNDTNDCILYAYDDNSDGGITFHNPNNPNSSNERHGFKLDEGDIKMRSSGENMNDCNNGNWIRLSDQYTEEITELTFTPSFQCINRDDDTSVPTDCSSPPAGTTSGETLVEVRHIRISMTGTLTGDNTVTKKLESSVRIRNDRILTQP